MMLIVQASCNSYLSTHIALHSVPKTLKHVVKVIDLAQETLKLMGFDEPRIAVAGLNPHCGEVDYLEMKTKKRLYQQ